MSVTKEFHKKIREAQVRCGVNLLLGQIGLVLAVAGLMAALAVLVERLMAVQILVPSALWAFWGTLAGLTLVLWLSRLPNRMQASLLLDERLRLRERFSTTLALAHSDDPFARAARAESLQAVQRTDLRGHFPIRLSQSWYYGAGTWLVVIALVLFMPEKDLLGLLKKKKQQGQQAKQLEEAKAKVRQTAEAVKAATQGLHDPALEEELKKLDEIAQAGQPHELKREAIKTLGDLSDKLNQMQSGGQIDAANMMERMLKKLRGSADPFSQQVRTALAKGDFAQAANILSQLQKDLAQGKLSDQQRKDMAAQLQQLAKELQKLAEQKRELEDQLEKLGLDKKLAQLSEQQLRQALQRQGLRQDLIDQLMQKMAATQTASGRCSGLAMAMAACGAGAGGLSADELSDAMDQLNALESLEQQAILLRAGLDQISQCIGQLGSGMSDEPGGQSPFQEGYSDGMGSGSGGPGMGFGPRDSDTAGQTGNKTTRVDGKGNEGPVIASWYFKDIQVKGEARRDFSQVVEAGRANAAEAISENQIPRKYEDAMKKYFGTLEQRGPQP
jgi:hypothetical protein